MGKKTDMQSQALSLDAAHREYVDGSKKFAICHKTIILFPVRQALQQTPYLRLLTPRTPGAINMSQPPTMAAINYHPSATYRCYCHTFCRRKCFQKKSCDRFTGKQTCKRETRRHVKVLHYTRLPIFCKTV